MRGRISTACLRGNARAAQHFTGKVAQVVGDGRMAPSLAPSSEKESSLIQRGSQSQLPNPFPANVD